MALTPHPDAASLYAKMREDRAENLARLAVKTAPEPEAERIAPIARRLNWRLILVLILNTLAWAAIVALWRA